MHSSKRIIFIRFTCYVLRKVKLQVIEIGKWLLSTRKATEAFTYLEEIFLTSGSRSQGIQSHESKKIFLPSFVLNAKCVVNENSSRVQECTFITCNLRQCYSIDRIIKSIIVESNFNNLRSKISNYSPCNIIIL